MKRHHHAPHDRGDIFGRWVAITALTASKTDRLPLADRQRISARIHLGYEDIAKGATPANTSWRDLTDAMNFLQSAVEMKWMLDSEGAIETAKAALLDGQQHSVSHGVIRMSGTSLAGLRNLMEQFDGVMESISAASYWQLVRHTQQRIANIIRGAHRQGDTVVML